MKCFQIKRHTDVSGISGTGVVAQGVQFDDKTVVVRWLKLKEGIEATTVMHPHIDNVVALHGHGGSSTVEWLDDELGYRV